MLILKSVVNKKLFFLHNSCKIYISFSLSHHQNVFEFSKKEKKKRKRKILLFNIDILRIYDEVDSIKQY